MTTDIFNRKGKYPPEVWIIGSGPKGLPYIEQIPSTGYQILLNGAIGIPRIDPNDWMCFDPACIKFDYWRKGLALRKHINTTRIFGWQLIGRADAEFYFRTEPPLMSFTRPDVTPMKGVLRGGGTIFSAALQLCYWQGVKRVNCIGIDFEGNTYYDGTKIETKIVKKSTGQWRPLVVASELIRILRAKGLGIKFVSPSKLEEDLPAGALLEHRNNIEIVSTKRKGILKVHQERQDKAMGRR